MPLYRTHFHLLNPVRDVTDAAGYLTRDDMSVFLRNRLADGPWRDVPAGLFPDGAAAVFYIVWDLWLEQSGCVDLYTSRLLTPDELGYVSDWVKGQCSDGLGEGFEQQDFACYVTDDFAEDMDNAETLFREKVEAAVEAAGEDADPIEIECELNENFDWPNENDYQVMASFDWETNLYTFSRVC